MSILDGLTPAQIARLKHRLLCRERFIPYIRLVAPWFRVEEVHLAMADRIEAMVENKIDRLMIFLPPRTGKSTMTSVFLPSWLVGKFPADQVMQIGYKVDLAKKFSRETQGIITSADYEWLFPTLRMMKGSRAAGHWRVEDISEVNEQLALNKALGKKFGEYNAAGVTSGIAGMGFNWGIIDDPMSEQDKDSKIAKDWVWEWYGPGFYTRRQPEHNAIVLTMTRWALDDLAGHLISEMKNGGDEWEILNVPAILNGDVAKKIYTMAKAYDPGDYRIKGGMQELQNGDSYMPRRWPMKELLRTKNGAGMRERMWNSLYMGNPSEDEGHILKRKYWRLWTKTDPTERHPETGKAMPLEPEWEHVFMVYDTAFSDMAGSSYSAMTCWGIFEHREEEGGRATMNMILLGYWKKRVEAPDLPKVIEALQVGSERLRKQYGRYKTDEELKHLREITGTKGKHIPGYEADKILIENKASGIWLIKELRRRKEPQLPVYPLNLPTGTSGSQLGKFARAQDAAIVLEQGSVWYMPHAWSEDVIDECAKCKFDGSDESDDLPDTVTAAMLYVRKTWLIELASDVDEEEEALAAMPRPQRSFYGNRS